MRTWHRPVLALLALFGLLLGLPGIIYAIGLARVHGRPIPADPASFSPEVIVSTWHRCSESSPLAVEAISPWGFAGNFLFDDSMRATPGERAAWRIASTHNLEHPVGNNLWWHTSGAALTIWITRHWSAEQIGATLVRDNLCK